MKQGSVINPMNISNSEDYFRVDKITDLSNNFREMKKYVQHLFIAVIFLVCSNFYLLYSASHLVKSTDNEDPYSFSPAHSSSMTLVEPHEEYVYDTLPDLSTSQSKHVVNLVDYTTMDSDYKDNIFNNLDSIIVQDGDQGTSRHQITKVNWLFDEADTMLLYTALGEVFALAANGTISAYDTVNGARRLLQSQVGWLEGKITDVIHHGTSYKQMRDEGKAYMKTRENKQEEEKLLREMTELNDSLERAELEGENITQYREKIEKLQDKREEVLKKRNQIPIMEQKPMKEKNVDEFLREQEIERIEKEYQEEKLQEITEFRTRKEEEVRAIKEEKKQIMDNFAREKNETVAALIEDKKMVMDTFMYALNSTRISKHEELKAIRYDLEETKSEIDQAKQQLMELIERETNATIKEKMMTIKDNLVDTTGKITFTQLSIDEDSVAEYDRRPESDRMYYDHEIVNSKSIEEIEDRVRPEGDRMYHEEDIIANEDYIASAELNSTANEEHIASEDDREKWVEESIENIVKSCSTFREQIMCVCTDKLTREIYRC